MDNKPNQPVVPESVRIADEFLLASKSEGGRKLAAERYTANILKEKGHDHPHEAAIVAVLLG